jgi:hypothetical protein
LQHLPRIYLLSPAFPGGKRGRMLLNERAEFDLAVRLRGEGASLGEVFSFISGLYFRGKLAYARAFAAPPPGLPGSLVITAGRGLVEPDQRISLDELLQIASVPIDSADPRYTAPLEQHARSLAERAGTDCQIVLLGSIATAKYLEPLIETFGDRLLFPAEFAGRGDMSRGGLMLRCVSSGSSLTYVAAVSGPRHGPRPPKLARLTRI